MAANYYIDQGVPSISHSYPKTMDANSALNAHHYYKLLPQAGEYGATGGHSYKKDRDTRSIGLSVLTLLSFLFFLHLLQNCVQEQADQLNPQIVIMQAKLRGDQTQITARSREFEDYVPR